MLNLALYMGASVGGLAVACAGYFWGDQLQNSLIDLVDRLNNSGSGPEIYETSRHFFRNLGFRYVNVGVIDADPMGATGMYSDMSAEWMSHYLRSGYGTCDPLVAMCTSFEGEVIMSNDDMRALPSPDQQMAARMWEEVKGEGVDSTVTFIRRSRNGRKTVGINLPFEEDVSALKSLAAAHRTELQIGAALTQSHLFQDTEPTSDHDHWHRITVTGPALSKREREVLLRIAQGLRPPAIADRLGITTATVNFHIKSAKTRLGAKTREQAVATAILQGLLDI